MRLSARWREAGYVSRFCLFQSRVWSIRRSNLRQISSRRRRNVPCAPCDVPDASRVNSSGGSGGGGIGSIGPSKGPTGSSLVCITSVLLSVTLTVSSPSHLMTRFSDRRRLKVTVVVVSSASSSSGGGGGGIPGGSLLGFGGSSLLASMYATSASSSVQPRVAASRQCVSKRRSARLRRAIRRRIGNSAAFELSDFATGSSPASPVRGRLPRRRRPHYFMR